MSKILASEIYLSHLPKNQTAVSFIVDNKYIANVFVNELKNLDKIELTAKAHKESRSVRQNKLLWALVSKISDHINGEHSQESTMKIYSELLVKANEKYEFIAALESAKSSLETVFRAVIDTNQVRDVNGAKLNIYKVFIGSSKFDTKEMTNLIEITLNYASYLGISDSEIETIRSEYE